MLQQAAAKNGLDFVPAYRNGLPIMTTAAVKIGRVSWKERLSNQNSLTLRSFQVGARSNSHRALQSDPYESFWRLPTSLRSQRADHALIPISKAIQKQKKNVATRQFESIINDSSHPRWEPLFTVDLVKNSISPIRMTHVLMRGEFDAILPITFE